MTTASEVAKYILAHFRSKGESIINLKLQKLLYYSQAWHLALHGSPLFDDRIEAWLHGPVVPTVFREYKSFRWSIIQVDDLSCQLGAKASAHVDEVLKEYAKFTSWDLERMTHNEDPWKIARGGIPADMSSHSLITHESMKKFYSKQ